MQSTILKRSAGLLLAMVALVSFAAPAQAINSAKTTYGFSIPPTHNIGYTPSRQKQDNSVSYIRVDYRSFAGTTWAWVERAGNTSVSSQVRVLTTGTPATIYNKAYELYGRVQVVACLRNSKTHSTSLTIKGVWSPDTVVTR